MSAVARFDAMIYSPITLLVSANYTGKAESPRVSQKLKFFKVDNGVNGARHVRHANNYPAECAACLGSEVAGYDLATVGQK